MQPGEILSWYARLLDRIFVKEKFEPAYERKEMWLYKPLGGCSKCLGGQIAFWSSIYAGYGVADIIFITLATILLVKLIIKIF